MVVRHARLFLTQVARHEPRQIGTEPSSHILLVGRRPRRGRLDETDGFDQLRKRSRLDNAVAAPGAASGHALPEVQVRIHAGLVVEKPGAQ
jgi:hypothetical protein